VDSYDRCCWTVTIVKGYSTAVSNSRYSGGQRMSTWLFHMGRCIFILKYGKMMALHPEIDGRPSETELVECYIGRCSG